VPALSAAHVPVPGAEKGRPLVNGRLTELLLFYDQVFFFPPCFFKRPVHENPLLFSK
jgi:hypothetical protein